MTISTRRSSRVSHHFVPRTLFCDSEWNDSMRALSPAAATRWASFFVPRTVSLICTGRPASSRPAKPCISQTHGRLSRISATHPDGANQDEVGMKFEESRKVVSTPEKETLLEQVLCYHHTLDLIGALVDLGVPSKSSAPSAKPLIVRKIVHRVHPDKGSSSDL